MNHETHTLSVLHVHPCEWQQVEIAKCVCNSKLDQHGSLTSWLAGSLARWLAGWLIVCFFTLSGSQADA